MAIQCSCCGQAKTEYNFFNGKLNRETRYFITNPDWTPKHCFTCNGPYRCLGCGVVQDASQFRIGGRFCHHCKEAGVYRVRTEVYARNEAVASVDSLDAVKTLESGENAE